MSDLPVAFAELSAEQFPFKILFLDEATDEIVHEITVTGPGAIAVPSFKPRKVTVRTVWPNDTTITITSADDIIETAGEAS